MGILVINETLKFWEKTGVSPILAGDPISVKHY